jgi:hypothetical protein
MKSFFEYLNENIKLTENFNVFSANRLKGATDITVKAEKKGGDALLTYHHFVVKLPYYESAVKGQLNLTDARAELQLLMNELITRTTGDITIGQVEFQELVGKIEVLGELIIKSKP